MINEEINLVKIGASNFGVFINLGQAYEAEFSALTQKMPDAQGFFKIDTYPYPPYIGYLLFLGQIPVGFCVLNVEDEVKDIAEFYIIPVARKKKLGYKLAALIFNQYPGEWQVRQIEGADDATNFWRKTITKYTKNNYVESIISDANWGMVICQRFHTCFNKDEIY